MGSADTVWTVYLIECDSRLYAGVTTDLRRRLSEHRSGRSRAARSTRGRREITLRYAAAIGQRGTALRVERAVKRLTRREKLEIIAAQSTPTELLQRLGVDPGGYCGNGA